MSVWIDIAGRCGWKNSPKPIVGNGRGNRKILIDNESPTLIGLVEKNRKILDHAPSPKSCDKRKPIKS